MRENKPFREKKLSLV